jgi:hypothetical protein
MRTKTRKRRKRKGVGKTGGTRTHHSMMSLDLIGDKVVVTNLGYMESKCLTNNNLSDENYSV